SGIWCTKLAFRLQICSFQFTNKHLALQTGVSDYNSASSSKGTTENKESIHRIAQAHTNLKYII
ncbi:hypothetical protein ACTQ1N_10870, partial [Porcincola sp. LCP21S3_C12]|uniref:hypothetical protein n=1 Tax=Porcincola sp. LCP21S3_C12 TaxID=3438798 RepID=UPI003F95808D